MAAAMRDLAASELKQVLCLMVPDPVVSDRISCAFGLMVSRACACAVGVTACCADVSASNVGRSIARRGIFIRGAMRCDI